MINFLMRIRLVGDAVALMTGSASSNTARFGNAQRQSRGEIGGGGRRPGFTSEDRDVSRRAEASESSRGSQKEFPSFVGSQAGVEMQTSDVIAFRAELEIMLLSLHSAVDGESSPRSEIKRDGFEHAIVQSLEDDVADAIRNLSVRSVGVLF